MDPQQQSVMQMIQALQGNQGGTGLTNPGAVADLPSSLGNQGLPQMQQPAMAGPDPNSAYAAMMQPPPMVPPPAPLY